MEKVQRGMTARDRLDDFLFSVIHEPLRLCIYRGGLKDFGIPVHMSFSLLPGGMELKRWIDDSLI